MKKRKNIRFKFRDETGYFGGNFNSKYNPDTGYTDEMRKLAFQPVFAFDRHYVEKMLKTKKIMVDQMSIITISNYDQNNCNILHTLSYHDDLEKNYFWFHWFRKSGVEVKEIKLFDDFDEALDVMLNAVEDKNDITFQFMSETVIYQIDKWKRENMG